MALQKELEMACGITCSEAYIVLEHVSWIKRNVNMNATARVYKDKSARDAGKLPLQEISASFEYLTGPSDPIMHVQAYTALKALDSLTDALDV